MMDRTASKGSTVSSPVPLRTVQMPTAEEVTRTPFTVAPRKQWGAQTKATPAAQSPVAASDSATEPPDLKSDPAPISGRKKWPAQPSVTSVSLLGNDPDAVTAIQQDSSTREPAGNSSDHVTSTPVSEQATTPDVKRRTWKPKLDK